MTFHPAEWQPEPVRDAGGRGDAVAAGLPATGLPASGWLPDPADPDLERYWDGARWTGRVRDRWTRMEHGVAPSAYTTPARTWSPAPEPRTRRGGRGGVSAGRRSFSILALVAVSLVAALGWVQRTGLVEGIPDLGAQISEAMTSTTQPEAPAVEYPVFGSTELVRYLGAAMVAQQESIDVTFWSRELGDAAVEDALREAYTQNPYAFVSGWEMWGSGMGVSIRPVYTYDRAEADRRRVLTRTAVDLGLEASRATRASSAREKATRIHDYLVTLGDYDYAAFEAINRGEDTALVARSQQAYGLLVEGTAVCNGYAQAFLAMAHAAGLEAVQVTGSDRAGATGGSHAWNKVLIDGEWLVVDVTWDDPSTNPRTSHDYLLLRDGDPRLVTRVTDSDWVVDANLPAYFS